MCNRISKHRYGKTRKGTLVRLNECTPVIEAGKVVGWMSYAYLSSTDYVDGCYIPNGDVE